MVDIGGPVTDPWRDTWGVTQEQTVVLAASGAFHVSPCQVSPSCPASGEAQVEWRRECPGQSSVIHCTCGTRCPLSAQGHSMEAGAAQSLAVSDELGQSVICMLAPHGRDLLHELGI